MTMSEESPEHFDLWVEADGKVVAKVSAVRRMYLYSEEDPADRKYAEITELWVKREERRRGIARRMLRSVHRWAAGYGYTHLAVEASANPGASGPALYDALGFEARSVIYDVEVKAE